MADDDTNTQTAPSPPPDLSGLPQDMLANALKQLLGPQQPVVLPPFLHHPPARDAACCHCSVRGWAAARNTARPESGRNRRTGRRWAASVNG